MKNLLLPVLFLLGTAAGLFAQECFTVTCPQPKTVNCGDTSWTFDAPTVVDTCCTNYSVVPGTPVSIGTCPQYVTQTWRIFDQCGHSNTCSQTVTVVNTNQPLFQGATDITVSSCTNIPVFFNVTASEACCGSLIVGCSPPSGSFFPPGLATFVTCTTTDCCGSAYSTTFYVHVLESQFLQVLPTDKYLACDDSNWSFDPPTVNDACCSGAYNYFPQPPVTNGIACPLTITEVWGVTDSCGNSNYCTETIYVTNGPVNSTNSGPVLTNGCPGLLYALSRDGTGIATLETISTSGGISPVVGVGTGFNALTYAAPDLGYGPDLFYAISNDATAFSTLYSISPGGPIAARFGLGSGFGALAFAAPDLGYGPNLFYAIATDGSGFSTLYTLSTSGATVARFGLGSGSGSGFNALAFAAPDMGYGPNLFYAIATNASGFSTLYTISTSGATVARFGFGSGFQSLAFAPDDLGYGPDLLYAISSDTTGFSTLSTIATSGATVARFGLGEGFGPLAYRPALFVFECPADMVVATPGTNAVVNYPSLVASNSCCGTNLTITFAPPSGSSFPLGATSVQCQAVDCSGNTNTCSFTVDVIPQSTAPTLSGNLTFNGSFEGSNYSGNGDIDSTDPAFTLPGWTWSAGSNHLFLEYGEPLGFARYADGSQAVCLRGQGTPVSLSQTFETTPGQNYVLRFAQSDESNSLPSCSELTVSVAGQWRVFSLTNDSGNHLWDDHGYRLQAMEFTAQSNWTTLTFTDSSDPGCPSPFLDSVCVNPGSATFANFNTPVPGGTRDFSEFYTPPPIAGTVAGILGADDNGDPVMCLAVPISTLIPMIFTNPPPPPQIVTVVDSNTQMPGGGEPFYNFLQPALSARSGGFDLAFIGVGYQGQEGVYGATESNMALPGNIPPSLFKIADASTPIPNGKGNFVNFLPNKYDQSLSPAISSGPSPVGTPTNEGSQTGVVFWGAGADDYEGIFYCGTPPNPTNPPAPTNLVDTGTPIPEGIGTFTTFLNANISPNSAPGPWKNFAVNRNLLGFYGAGTGGQQGLYGENVAYPSPVPWLVADTNTQIPNGTGNFQDFLGLDVATDPVVGRSQIAFVGLGAGGQQGVYSTALFPGDPVLPLITKIADTNTLIPGGQGTFRSFNGLACGGSYGISIAIVGTGGYGQKGIYVRPAADASGAAPFPLTKVIDLNDTLDGKTLADLQMGAGALDGAALAFEAIFTDGTEGLYTIPVIDNIFITDITANAGGVWLNVTTPAGYTYNVLSNTNLARPAWAPDNSQAILGNNGNSRWVNPVYQPNRKAKFLRVERLPEAP